VGASIGITVAPTDSTDPERLMKNADAALYRAKNTPISKYCFFEHEMDKYLQERAELTLGLHDAVATGQISIFYQPLISLKTGKINCVEALLRWVHPKLGPIAPKEFIPIAEDTGQINSLGHWALKRACLQAKSWPEDLKVAVNLSVAQIATGNLVADIEQIISETGLSPKRLELEVTESLLLSETSSIDETLKMLQAMGICMAMDDFGTGYSSLAYLHKFNFEKIKIDRSLVSYLSNDNGGNAIALAAIQLGKDLGIAVTAEGVENQKQLEQVRSYGCSQAQGFLFSSAIPASEIEGLLDRVWF
jgi:predicted signal transduction protein with EAL and GGDEF domain